MSLQNGFWAIFDHFRSFFDIFAIFHIFCVWAFQTDFKPFLTILDHFLANIAVSQIFVYEHFKGSLNHFWSFYVIFCNFPHFLCMGLPKGFWTIFDHFRSLFGYFCNFYIFCVWAFQRGFKSFLSILDHFFAFFAIFHIF